MNQYLDIYDFFNHLRLFEFLVIVGLQLDKRTKDVLVLIGILIAQQHMLGLLIHARLL